MKAQLTAIAALFALSTAAAQDAGHLNVRTTVQKEEVVVDEDGRTSRKLVPADTVVPGEDVVYTITFTNISDEVAENIVITNPIATDLTYVEGSAYGPGTEIEFSVDGGRTFAAPGDLTVDEAGESRPAEAADVTHVRWTMTNTLVAGAQGMASFRATLN